KLALRVLNVQVSIAQRLDEWHKPVFSALDGPLYVDTTQCIARCRDDRRGPAHKAFDCMASIANLDRVRSQHQVCAFHLSASATSLAARASMPCPSPGTSCALASAPNAFSCSTASRLKRGAMTPSSSP